MQKVTCDTVSDMSIKERARIEKGISGLRKDGTSKGLGLFYVNAKEGQWTQEKKSVKNNVFSSFFVK